MPTPPPAPAPRPVTITLTVESDGPTMARLIVPASMLGLGGCGTVVVTAQAG